MCLIFSKKRQKQFDDLQKRIDELTKIVKNQEFERLQARSEELKVQDEQLSKLQVKLAKIEVSQTNTGETMITLKYAMPDIVLYLDDDGEPFKNETFYAINRLDLLEQKDTDKIRNVLEREKRKIKNV